MSSGGLAGLVCVAALALAACAADGEGGGGAGGAGASAATTEEASSIAPAAATGGAPECRSRGWSPTTDQAYAQGGAFFYSAVVVHPDAYDTLDFQFYEDAFGVGEHPITTADYYGCTVCVHISVQCDPGAEGVSCGDQYLANAGTIEIDSVTGRFSGRLRDVELVEVTIDQNHSTPVPRGLTWCLDDYEFDVPIGDLE